LDLINTNDSKFNVILTFRPPSYFKWKHAQIVVTETQGKKKSFNQTPIRDAVKWECII